MAKTPEYARWWRDEPQHIQDFWDGKGVSRTAPAAPIGVLLYDAILTRLVTPGETWQYRVDAIAAQYRRQSRPPGARAIQDTPWEAIAAVERIFQRELSFYQLVRPRSLVFYNGGVSAVGEILGKTVSLHVTP
jgi:hypothetical protein